MDISWENTREALKNFADILTCSKCGNEPVAATRYTNCGHFFCKQCIARDSECVICNTPVQPVEIRPDHMVANLVNYCNIIADIVQEEDLWNTTADTLDTSRMSKIIPQTQSKINNKKFQRKYTLKNINKRNPKGETPLHTACIKKQEDQVKSLLAAGANPNTKDHADWTPLQEIVNFGHPRICQLLLEAGASPNIPGVESRTALHEAVIYNRLEEAKMLLQYSAKTDVYDQCGKTPKDYCSTEEMRQILTEKGKADRTCDKVVELNRTLDQSFCTGEFRFVVFPSNLKEQNRKLLSQMAVKHKMKITSSFRSSVTHVIVEANRQNIVNLSYDVMMAILRGNWLLNSEWISLGIDLDDISGLDLELFEVSGAPVLGIPKKARENAQNQKRGLFYGCHFYFALHAKHNYDVGEVQLTKDSLMRLVTEGEGNVLVREPDPEDVKDRERVIPFHTAHDSSHPLYKCTNYIIYVPGRDEPRIKYNMPHIKTLPLMWLIECIEKFMLVNPSHLGLL